MYYFVTLLYATNNFHVVLCPPRTRSRLATPLCSLQTQDMHRKLSASDRNTPAVSLTLYIALLTRKPLLDVAPTTFAQMRNIFHPTVELDL